MVTYTASAPAADSAHYLTSAWSNRAGAGQAPEAPSISFTDEQVRTSTLPTKTDGVAFVSDTARTAAFPHPQQLESFVSDNSLHTDPGQGFASYGVETDESAISGMVYDEDPTGSVIPASYFRKVSGRAVDENGDPISEGLYVLAVDDFSTAGVVEENGEFEIFLLRQTYTVFVLVGDEDPEEQEGYDLVWYETADSPDVDTTTGEVELTFNVEKPQAPDDAPTSLGLNMTSDVAFGGR